MKKSIEKKRTPVQLAMKDLRDRMGLTQAKLAQLMRVQLPSLGAWEAGEPPRGVALARLLLLARAVGARGPAGVFQTALAREALKRPDTQDLIEEIEGWGDLQEAFVDHAANIRKLEKETLKDSGLTNAIKLSALSVQLAYCEIWRVRWRQELNQQEKFDL
jgi:transcriptional regulator with XRE-family HTH domain